MASHGEYNRRGSHKQPLPPARQILEPGFIQVRHSQSLAENILYAFRSGFPFRFSFCNDASIAMKQTNILICPFLTVRVTSHGPKSLKIVLGDLATFVLVTAFVTVTF